MVPHIDITSNMIAMLLHAKHSMAIVEWDDTGLWYGEEHKVLGMGESKWYQVHRTDVRKGTWYGGEQSL